MKNKGVIGALVVSLFVFAIALSFLIYTKNLSGVLPAILPSKGNITDLVPPSFNDNSETAGTNSTQIPFTVPDGFDIGIFAKDLVTPRVLLVDNSSRILVSIPKQGKVLSLPDDNVDGVADDPIVVASNLNKPHGLALRCEGNAAVQKCWLYIAEEDKVRKWNYDQATDRASNPVKIVDLPTGGNHTSRTIQIMDIAGTPKLLVSTGSSCNVCLEKDARRASIWYANLDGTDFKLFATGLRNTVFFTKHPNTDEIWGTEMGRDLLGDNTPPDEVNIILPPDGSAQPTFKVKDYGWPFCYGKSLEDTVFDKTQAPIHCNKIEVMGSHLDLPAHSAPLGLAFIPNDGAGGWPEEWRDNLLIAFHGSWNSSTPVGYKIARYHLDEAGAYKGESDFLTGFLQSRNAKQALGRPVDILVLPGGIAYISDDKAGVIYKMQVRHMK